MELTQDSLKAILSYDRETGLFTRLVKISNNPGTGRPVGSLQSKGYVQIPIFGKAYLAHRLAWFYVYGEWPSGLIDHIDGSRANNRFANLREATSTQNQQNKRKRTSTTSKWKGVSWHSRARKWKSSINISKGKELHIGYFAREENAATAYNLAAILHHGEFARLNE